MRSLLEPELAAMAAASITDETLRRLGDEIDRMAALEADPEAYLEVDHEFHMEICRAADNRILDRIMYSARWLGTASRRVTNEAPSGLRRATAEHTEILDALVARDPDRARAAMRGHLDKSYSTFLAERQQRSKR
jgi:DNA-binding FadR family transcriptional regulator